MARRCGATLRCGFACAADAKAAQVVEAAAGPVAPAAAPVPAPVVEAAAAALVAPAAAPVSVAPTLGALLRKRCSAVCRL